MVVGNSEMGSFSKLSEECKSSVSNIYELLDKKYKLEHPKKDPNKSLNIIEAPESESEDEIDFGNAKIIEELKNEGMIEVYDKLYARQQKVIMDMLQHMKSDKNPDTLLDITTGFGKSYLQIVFAYILECLGKDYFIIVPDNLVEQLKENVDEFLNPSKSKEEREDRKNIVEELKKKIKGHKDFLSKEGKWRDVYLKGKQDIFLMFDEADIATGCDLFKHRIYKLSEKSISIFLSATAQKNLHDYIKEKGGKIITISLKEKVKALGVLASIVEKIIAKTVIVKTNSRSEIFKFAVLIGLLNFIIIMVKVSSNSVLVDRLNNLLKKFNLYNFYVSVFLINPIIGLLSFSIVFTCVIYPLNRMIEKAADRNITGRLIAWLTDSEVVNTAYESRYAVEEMFTKGKKSNSSQNKNKVESPEMARVKREIQSLRGKKALILASDDKTVKDLNRIYRLEGEGIKQGKEHDAKKLGRDFGEKFDYSWKEHQRKWCIKKFTDKLRELRISSKRNNNKIENDIVSKVDFSDDSTYAEYTVMHGIINSTILAILYDVKNKIDCKNELENFFKKEGSSEWLSEDIIGSIKDIFEFLCQEKEESINFTKLFADLTALKDGNKKCDEDIIKGYLNGKRFSKESSRYIGPIKTFFEFLHSKKEEGRELLHEFSNRIDLPGESSEKKKIFMILRKDFTMDLLKFLDNLQNKSDERKYKDLISLNKARFDNFAELLEDLSEALKNRKGCEDNVEKYLREKGFLNSQDMQKHMKDVFEFLHKEKKKYINFSELFADLREKILEVEESDYENIIKEHLKEKGFSKESLKDIVGYMKTFFEFLHEKEKSFINDLLSHVKDTKDVKEFFEKQNLKDLSESKIKAIENVLEFLSDERQKSYYENIVYNWNLDKAVHDLMKKGDEYQILEDMVKLFDDEKSEDKFKEKLGEKFGLLDVGDGILEEAIQSNDNNQSLLLLLKKYNLVEEIVSYAVEKQVIGIVRKISNNQELDETLRKLDSQFQTKGIIKRIIDMIISVVNYSIQKVYKKYRNLDLRSGNFSEEFKAKLEKFKGDDDIDKDTLISLLNDVRLIQVIKSNKSFGLSDIEEKILKNLSESELSLYGKSFAFLLSKQKLLSRMAKYKGEVFNLLKSEKEVEECEKAIKSEDYHKLATVFVNYRLIDEITSKKELWSKRINKSVLEEFIYALKTKNYESLAVLFKNYKLKERINGKLEHFPLYGLREVCQKNKIIFNLAKSEGNQHIVYGFKPDGSEIEFKYEDSCFNKLILEGWVGKIVDPSKYVGHSDVNNHVVISIIDRYDDPLLDPDKIYQAYGRNRGLDKTQQPVYISILRDNKIKPTLDPSILMKRKDANGYLFDARDESQSSFLKQIREEISQDIIKYVVDCIDRGGISDSNKTELREHCEKVIFNQYENLYKKNDHELKTTKEEFNKVLSSVKTTFVNYEKNIKNQGKPSLLYSVPYYVLYVLDKVLYYCWIFPDYVLFSLGTFFMYRKNSDINNETTYIHVIKNYSIQDSIDNKLILEKFVQLCEQRNNMFDSLLKTEEVIKAITNTIKPLQDKHLLTILNAIYVNEKDEKRSNEKKVELIYSFIKNDLLKEVSNGVDKGESTEEQYKDIIGYIIEVTKEILACQSWYHDSMAETKSEEPKLKIDNRPIFMMRNIGNMRRFFSEKDYRQNYGNKFILGILYVLKWFLLLVIFPQIPYLFCSTFLATTISTIVICMPLMSFVFGCPEKFRSFLFNQQSNDVIALEMFANKEVIPILKNDCKVIVEKTVDMLSKLEKLSNKDIEEKDFLSPLDKACKHRVRVESQMEESSFSQVQKESGSYLMEAT